MGVSLYYTFNISICCAALACASKGSPCVISSSAELASAEKPSSPNRGTEDGMSSLYNVCKVNN